MTTTSLFLILNIQISHHLEIARLIEAGGAQMAQDLLQIVEVKKSTIFRIKERNKIKKIKQNKNKLIKKN